MADSTLVLLSLIPFSLLIILYFLVRPRPVKIPLKNRHIFITGGSSGIGLALAHRAAVEGASHISLLARSLSKLQEARDSIRRASGVEVAIYAADVRDFEAVQRAMEQAGEIDVLVVNQGVFVAEEMEKQGIDGVKFMIDVNLIGSFGVIKAALKGMKEGKGRRGPRAIGIVSSQAGQVRGFLSGFCGFFDCALSFSLCLVASFQ